MTANRLRRFPRFFVRAGVTHREKMKLAGFHVARMEAGRAGTREFVLLPRIPLRFIQATYYLLAIREMPI
jgi:hypothetical protein